MSQKVLSEFFQPRKRQRPDSLKDGLTKSVLASGRDEPVREPKRFKQDKSGSTSRTQTGVQFHMSKEQVLMSLRNKSDVKSQSNSNDKRPQQKRPSKIVCSDVSQSLKGPRATSHDLDEMREGTDDVAAVHSADLGASASKKQSPHISATPRSVQRNLFGNAHDNKREPQKERLSTDIARRNVAPGMSPQKMKESLMNCNSISQLKDKLAGYNKAARRLEDFRSAKQATCLKDPTSTAKKTIEFEITSPAKSPRKNIASPSPKKTPAFVRFQHLIHDAPSSLVLPHKFRFLKEAFHCLDTVVSFLHNRKEIITFKKLKSSVQEMLNRNFSEAQLAQIKTVFPFAYIFRREKDLPNHKVTPNNKNKWQLTLEVNTNYELDMKSQGTAAGCAGAPTAVPAARGSAEYRKLSPAMLLERGRIFHASLLNLLLQHHQEFLEQLDPPVTVDPARITRWHPEFPLEKVPDVPAAALPVPPPDETGGTARDVLERARGLVSKYPHLRETLEAVAGPAATAAEPPPQPGPSSHLPAGLLERIRAREAARQQRLMTRTPAESRRLNMLSRLPQLARGLRATFVTERRAALPLETVLTRLADSSRGLAECDDLCKHVELLAEEEPQFVQMVQLKSGTFVKMAKDVDVNAVVTSLEKKLEKQ